MTNKIKLGTEVVVSDPCYTIPTWCQAVVNKVKPGMYDTHLKKHDAGDWVKDVQCYLSYTRTTKTIY